MALVHDAVAQLFTAPPASQLRLWFHQLVLAIQGIMAQLGKSPPARWSMARLRRRAVTLGGGSSGALWMNILAYRRPGCAEGIAHGGIATAR